MKKTRILVALLLASLMAFAVVLAACAHTHTFEEGWTTDSTSHWHKATCEHDDATSGKAPHNFNSLGLCKVCGYDMHDIDASDLLPYADNTVLRIAGGYKGLETAISFQSSNHVGSGVTLIDGKTYKLGDLKPTWVQISNDMKIKFEDVYTGEEAKNEFPKWEKEGLDRVDIVAGTATLLQEGGAKGELINLAEHLDKMPNFKIYLESNPLVRMSMTGSTTGTTAGAIYFSPYFDGVDDIERYPLVRSDMVKKLLDEDISGLDDRALATAAYQPYMPTTGSVAVESLKADGSGTETITKDYTKYGNIIAKMNAKSNLKGKEAVEMFREYIDKTYDGHYTKRSDLFLGYDAAWDADELVALLRCAVANLHDSDGNPISGVFPREDNYQRQVDLYRFAGSLFGVRGMESRQDYLYFDNDGKLHDARMQADTYVALNRLGDMYKEKLVTITGHVNSGTVLEKDAGIVSYDYNQTQTIMNNTKLNLEQGQTGEEYIPMMVPVAKWSDGTEGGVYMRFTESWRSVKTEGWAISKAGVGNDTNKLNAALALIDFAFSVQGQITMSYGSDDFIQVKDASVVIKTWADVEKKYVTEDFNGQQMPKIKDALYKDMQERVANGKSLGGNYTNYARWFLGSTLNGFPKSQAFEFQCTHPVAKAAAAKVSTAIARGTIKHPLLRVESENMWYTSVPTTLPTTTTENTQIGTYKELTATNFSTDSKNANRNIFLLVIANGLTAFDASVTTPAAAANYVATNWSGTPWLNIKNDAWGRLLAYYNK